jgi:hypothetical protein
MPASSGCFDTVLDYQGAAFSKLPAGTGLQDGNAKKTNGSAGFLVYGPYSSLHAGKYELAINGSSGTVEGAYVDIISGGGKSVYGRFNLEKNVKGPLLFKSVVDVPTNVPDLEVRVWVDQQDVLELTGYSLKPVAAR